MRLIDADVIIAGCDAVKAIIGEVGSNEKAAVLSAVTDAIRETVEKAETVDVFSLLESMQDTCEITDNCEECSFSKMCAEHDKEEGPEVTNV